MEYDFDSICSEYDEIEDIEEKYCSYYSSPLFSPDATLDLDQIGLNYKSVFHSLNRRKNKKERYGLLVDCDFDGFASARICFELIKMFCPQNSNDVRLFVHKGKEHGLDDFIMGEIEKDPVDILIISDAGSNQNSQILSLKNIGVKKCYVLDHHEKSENSYKQAINPCFSECENNTISGAFVCYKFLHYCAKLLGVFDLYDWENLLNLVAMSTVTDICPMNNVENQLIVYKSSMLNKSFSNKYFWGYLYNSVANPVSNFYHNVGFCVGPLINALCRGDNYTVKKDIISVFIFDRKELYDKAVVALKECHYQQRKIVNQISGMIEQNKNYDNDGVKCYFLDGYTNYKGLIANKKLNGQKAVFIVSFSGTNEYTGSLRSKYPILTHINTGNLATAIGHEQAAGIKIPQKNLVHFLDNMREYLHQKILRRVIVKRIEFKDVNRVYSIFIRKYQFIFGQDFPSPFFYFEFDIIKNNISIYKKEQKNGQIKSTIKFHHQGTDGLLFNAQDAIVEQIELGPIKQHIRAIGEVYNNVYGDIQKVQVRFSECEISNIIKEDEDNDDVMF